METPEQCVKSYCCHSGVFTVNYEQIAHIVLVLPLLTLNKKINHP